MLRAMFVYCARHPIFRRAASWAFRLPGIGGGLRKVAESIVPPEERIWIQVPSGIGKGLWLKVLPKWEPGYLAGCAEEGMNEALTRHLKPGDCFYDVGAHIGFYSLIAARLVGPAGHISAFEPDPKNAETLRENASRNGFSAVCVVCAAVSDGDEVVQFRRSGQDGPSRMSGMMVRENLPGTPGSEIFSCSAVSLDSICASHRTPNLVKIDVEGAELRVLDGARSLLGQNKPVLIIEIHDQKDLSAVRSLLSGFGYALEPLKLKAGETGGRHFVACVRSSLSVTPLLD